MPTPIAKSRLDRLRERRLDPLVNFSGVNEVYNRLTKEDSAIQYAIGAMQPIDADYTRLTIEERDRIEAQLKQGLSNAGLSVSFDYQGSVTNDTHIRAHSDVDLLTVEEKWISIEQPNRPTIPYQGNGVDDLRKIRKESAAKLKAAFPTAKVDESGSKAITISGGSLRRKIDVIACGLWHTVEYVQQRQKHWLGIKVLDNDAGKEISNKPFLHNKLIEERDATSNGGLRKSIRLLKSLKYDSDEAIELSSYDVAGIVYNMSDAQLYSRSGQDLVLIKNCHTYLYLLELMPGERDKIFVPNKMRKVFCSEGASEKGLRQMRVALGVLIQEIETGLNRSSRKLTEAEISY